MTLFKNRGLPFTAIALLLALATLAAAPVMSLEPDSPAFSHPTILPPLRWPGALVIGILGWFAMSAVIGIAVQANAPEETLPKRSRLEPPRDEEVIDAE